MKNKILIIALVLVVVAVGVLAYNKSQTKQEPKQTAQELRVQRDISEIRKFADTPDLSVQYENESKSSNGMVVPVGVYMAGADRYEVDANGKIIEFGSRNLPIGNESEKIVDNTSRYTQQELEAMAKQFITKNTPDVYLDALSLSKNIKGTNYFFRWEDKSQKTIEGYPFIQVGFSQGGTLLNYTNTLR
ncbi:MAG: hypothetical protein US63_C0006G0009 [Candidatus Moranbacteria bacterium GW2011_GWC2_37_8]|nr:MAG: hypothetical protein US63_C0006G0009 [Candidatus Moranbacteria bacterium GW2011_GWC2_37_8]KKQ62435.1 MAG: hypothetical protein US82_C0011G0009 [Parcubacteria group bacterium GW2011_GWC1_38_22]KKQ80293.1 MAG: hypothetical protein UT03_C0028G0009 [Candidatus Moranbacteria bacterium GW2011_GWD2_38_7]